MPVNPPKQVTKTEAVTAHARVVYWAVLPALSGLLIVAAGGLTELSLPWLAIALAFLAGALVR